MKKVNLCLFFLRNDEADNLLEAEQTREEDGAAIDGKGDDKANHPVDIQLLDEEGDQRDGDHEQHDMEPIAAAHVEFEDALGDEVLQECRDGLHAEAGAGCAHRLEPWNDDEIEQDIDNHARSGYKIELLEAAVGGKQGAEDVSC